MDMLAKVLHLTATDLCCLSLASVLLYAVYSTRHFRCFKNQGIPGPRPWPIFGNILHSAKMGRLNAQKFWIEKYGKSVGVFVGSLPCLMTTDPDILKNVMVKEFAAFCNRPNVGINTKTFSQTLVALRDGEWKNVRTQLSPAFSSAKLKQMMPDMKACSALLRESLLAEVDNREGISVQNYSTRHFRCFKNQGIPGPRPWPIFGNILHSAKMGRLNAQKFWIEKYGKSVGVFVGSLPCLMTTDPDILKNVMVKEFAAFCNRPNVGINTKTFSQTLVALRDGEWKNVRTQLSPAFSSAKLKQMMPDMKACSALLRESLLAEVDNREGISVQKFTGAFTMDVIARTVFSLEINSQLEPDSPFVIHARQAFASLKTANPAVILRIIFPFLKPLFHCLNMTTMDSASEEFFTKVIKEAMKKRKEDNTGRLDFLQQMLNCSEEGSSAPILEDDAGLGGKSAAEHASKEGHRKGLTDTQILANSILFFIAAYDTTSSTLMFLLYNLAMNPECQQKVMLEVDRVMGDTDEVEYEMLAEMTYLNKCIQETLRMYPPAVSVTREANRDIFVNGVMIQKNTMIVVPIYVLHRDPEVWPQPDKFNPERFAPEAIAARNTFSYMPFSAGPHNCIGMRLALQEIKTVMAVIMRRFRFVPCSETQSPLTFKSSMMLTPEKDIKLAVEQR